MGVKHALAKKPRPPSDTETKRAARLPTVLRSRVAELLDATKPSRKSPAPELPDYMEMQETLAKGVDEDLLVETMLGIPPDLQAACSLVWSRGVAYLESLFPRRVEMRLTGPKLHEPSRGDWAEWGWAWRIANAPMFVIDLAADGMLIGVEVRHFESMFPALYIELVSALNDGMADKMAANKDWTMPWWLEKQLGVILKTSRVSRTLLADIEAAVKQSQAEVQSRTSALKITRTGETQQQKLADR